MITCKSAFSPRDTLATCKRKWRLKIIRLSLLHYWNKQAVFMVFCALPPSEKMQLCLHVCVCYLVCKWGTCRPCEPGVGWGSCSCRHWFRWSRGEWWQWDQCGAPWTDGWMPARTTSQRRETLWAANLRTIQLPKQLRLKCNTTVDQSWVYFLGHCRVKQKCAAVKH